MNGLIVKRIKETRLERNLTQHDIAEYLGRSTAAISELERGRVQVSAEDLYNISRLFNKPIEYFYGEEYGEKEVQDLIAVLRKQPQEARKHSIETTNLILQMQQIADSLKENPEKDLSIEELKGFLGAFIEFSKQINELTVKMNDLRDKLVQELKLQGIDISSS